MGTTNPPSAWYVGSGTWGTDMDQNSTVTKVGGYSVEFKNTTPASDPRVHSRFIPCQPDTPYIAKALMRADSVAGGNTMSFMIQWYTTAQAFISNSVVHNAVMPAVDTWYEMAAVVTAPSTAAFYKVRISKANNAFTGYFDYAFNGRALRGFLAHNQAAQTLPIGDYVRIMFDTEEYDYGSQFVPGSTGSISAWADAGGGDVRATCTAAHGLSQGDKIQIYDTTNYDVYFSEITNVSDATHFDITAAWAGDDGQGEWVYGGIWTAGRDGQVTVDAQVTLGNLDDGEYVAIFLLKNSTIYMVGDASYSPAANKDQVARISTSLIMDRGDTLGVVAVTTHAGGLDTVVGAGTIGSCFFSVTEGTI